MLGRWLHINSNALQNSSGDFMRKLLAATLLLLGIALFGCVQPPQETKDSALYSLVNADAAGSIAYGEAYEEGIKELQRLSPLAIPANLNLVKNVRFALVVPKTDAFYAGGVDALFPAIVSAAETPLGAKEFALLTQGLGGAAAPGYATALRDANFTEKTVLGRSMGVFEIRSSGQAMDMTCVWKEGGELVSVTTLNCTGYIERNFGKGNKERFMSRMKDGLALKDKLSAKGKLFGIGALSGEKGDSAGAIAFGDSNADYFQIIMKSSAKFYCSGSRETRSGREYCVDKPTGMPANMLSVSTYVGGYALGILAAVKGDESAAKEAALAALDAVRIEGEPARIESTAINPKGEYHSSTTAVPTPVAEESSAGQEALARCLTQKGWAMYGVDTCPWCAKQKQEFGSAFGGVRYVNCAESAECREKQITGYPTWISPDGAQHQGFKTLEQLRELSGCM
jgi:hypothetical protein